MDENVQLSSSLSFQNGFLFCEGVKVKHLQDSLSTLYPNHSSPVFVYSRRQIIENIQAYQAALDDFTIDYKLGYSMKANYNPEIVKLVAQSGCWAVAVSGFEVALAMRQGIQPANIILNGNGKQLWEIETAVKHGCLINVDSAYDLQNIIKVTNKLDKKVKVLIRLNPNINADVHPFLATGLANSKFGIEEKQLFDLLDVIKISKNLELIGLHCHLGSTIDNTFVFSECLDVMASLVDTVRQQGFTELSVLNLGGGLGISYRQHEQRTKCCDDQRELSREFEQNGAITLIERIRRDCGDQSEEIISLLTLASGMQEDFDREKLKRLKALLNGYKEVLYEAKTLFPSLNAQIDMPTPSELIASIKDRLRKSNYRLILEPGRSLVGNAGTLVTKVIGVKKNGSKRYVVVDGSMTEVIRPVLYGAYHHMELTEPCRPSTQEPAKQTKDVYDVVGPVCECGDFLGKDRLLVLPHEGCGLAVFDVGAYCSSMASNYNMRPRPAEVMIDGSDWQVIRKPETLENILTAYST